MSRTPARIRTALFAAAAAAVVATATPSASVAADSCPNAAVRAQQKSQFLTNCGAYELISPAEKNGGSVKLLGGTDFGYTLPATTGEAVTYGSSRRFADGVGGLPTGYRSRRTPAGWTTQAITPPVPLTTNPGVGSFPQMRGITPDGSRVFGKGAGSLDPSENPDSDDVYEFAPGGVFSLLSRGTGSERVGTWGSASYRGTSADGSRVFFSTDAHLTPQDAGRGAFVYDIYERVGNETRLVNSDDNGNALNTCGSEIPRSIGAALSNSQAISQDGRTVVFTTPSVNDGTPECAQPAQLYARTAEGETVEVSASQRDTPDPDGRANSDFMGASEDGRIIVFANSESLTNDAPDRGGIYRYDMQSGDLTLWKASPNARALGLSPDASTLYYFTSSSGEAPGATPVANADYYMYALKADGSTVYAGVKTTDSSQGSNGWANQTTAVSRNGRYLQFQLEGGLIDPQGNTIASSGGFAQYQAWRFDLNTQTLVCASCRRADGQLSTSNVQYGPELGGERLAVPNDGSVVFDSADQLVPQDTNTKRDVYRYRDDRLELISPGDKSDAILIGQSHDARTVIFGTAQQLAPQDIDQATDLYAARDGGGFLASVSDPPEPCREDACQPRGSAPSGSAPGTTGFQGPGDAKARRRAAVSVAAPKRIRGSKGLLSVRVTGAGRLGVSGRGLRSASRATGRAASYPITVRLTRKAAVRLRKRGKATVTVTVTFKPSSGAKLTRQVTVRFARPATKGSAR